MEPICGFSATFTLLTRNGLSNYFFFNPTTSLYTQLVVQQSAVKVTDILFDAGFTSREGGLEYGCRPGDTIVPDVETIWTANKKRDF